MSTPLGRNLQHYMDLKGFDKRTLSESSGVTLNTITKILNNNMAGPSTDDLISMAKSLDIYFYQLFELSKSEQLAKKYTRDKIYDETSRIEL